MTNDKLDPLLRGYSELPDALSDVDRVLAAMFAEAEPAIPVLAEVEPGAAGSLADTGLLVQSSIGRVVTGFIPVSRLPDLAEHPEVVRVESSRPLEQELDVACVDTGVDLARDAVPPGNGAGVIVGIIDSGIDYTHPAFLRPDGTTRILAIWDQALNRRPDERHPSGRDYGVEYTSADIDAALAEADPFSKVRHRDSQNAHYHGTHVAGIAAGSGSDGASPPDDRFRGVAPDADIVVVANNSRRTTSDPADQAALGSSMNTIDALAYILEIASSRQQPVVINQSQGDNLGPHDGTSLLEVALDEAVGEPGVCIVKSAGNAAGSDCHAEGNVAPEETETLTLRVPPQKRLDIIDIWYSGAASFEARVGGPGAALTEAVAVGERQTFSGPNGDRIVVDHRDNDRANGDKRIYVELRGGPDNQVTPGVWTVELRNVSANQGEFHAWIQRHTLVSRFQPPHVSQEFTLSVPGTARDIITVANYGLRSPLSGARARSSSIGPTRDGRPAPTIAAPGSEVFSAAAYETADRYVAMSGTSMSAPHVAGVIALLLQADPGLTQQRVRDVLVATARSDAQTGGCPNTFWGSGKLDARAAVEAVRPERG
jgi:subtilisin family serine protease